MDKTSKYYLSSLDKVTHPTIGNTLKSQRKIAAILTNYPCDTTESGSYGHALLIYSNTIWLNKDSITTTVAINKPATFTGTTYASRYAYDKKLKRYNEMIKHQKGVVKMIKYIFLKPIFLDLCNN